MLLLTDGRSRDANLIADVAAMQKDGITLSTVGIGDEVDERLLSFLAWMGHGRSYRVTDPSLLPQIVLKEARQVDGSLIRERPFTPLMTAAGSLSSSMSSLPELRGMVLTWLKGRPRALPCGRSSLRASS